MARRGRQTILLALLAALVVVGTVAFASTSTVPVKLKLTGSFDRNLGQAARLTATAKLPTGAHLLINAFRTGKAPAKVRECLRSPCTASYARVAVGSVQFQAFAIKRSGKKTTVLGRSNRVKVTWSTPEPTSTTTTTTTTPAPPPPPAPAATPGHYSGKTADNELFAFDIGADGLGLTNLQTGQMNQHCDPPGNLSGGNISAAGPFPVALDGSFKITLQGSGPIDGSTYTSTLAVTGHVSGGNASGTYREDTSFTLNGQGYGCTTGDQTWTASKV